MSSCICSVIWNGNSLYCDGLYTTSFWLHGDIIRQHCDFPSREYVWGTTNRKYYFELYSVFWCGEENSRLGFVFSRRYAVSEWIRQPINQWAVTKSWMNWIQEEPRFQMYRCALLSFIQFFPNESCGIDCNAQALLCRPTIIQLSQEWYRLELNSFISSNKVRKSFIFSASALKEKVSCGIDILILWFQLHYCSIRVKLIHLDRSCWSISAEYSARRLVQS
jgi:hypothetical protein